MDIAYQQPADLMLGIIQTELDHPLTILKQADWRVGSYQFRFHIIGESHVVRVERSGLLLFQEILACLPLHAHQCAHLHAFTSLTDHSYQTNDYSIAVRFSSAPPAGTIKNSRHLEMRFPRIHGAIPITRIDWQQTSDMLIWRTLHTYPDAARTLYVYSHSQWHCR